MSNTDISVLEQTLERYPWFALGHYELFRKACELGEEHKRDCLNRTAAHIYSREVLYNLSREERKVHADDLEDIATIGEEIAFEIEEEPLDIQTVPKIVMAGGDYFSRAELDEAKLDLEKPLDKFISEKPSLLKSNINSPKDVEIAAEQVLEENFDDSGFYTETLAKIYSEQGFYKRAIEVYAKLILLYPEKNSYFATLVQELKSKHNLY
ncbi:hypothetical protein BRDCF_p81 [Bacteroidales bacterium CF]|nr:hypothetical protein BRDCF_p81 [Bacteroidales bacterium CF]